MEFVYSSIGDVTEELTLDIDFVDNDDEVMLLNVNDVPSGDGYMKLWVKNGEKFVPACDKFYYQSI